MPLRFKNCIEKGLLRKIPASEDNAIRSINKTESWLRESEKTLQSEAYDSSEQFLKRMKLLIDLLKKSKKAK